MKPVVIFFSGLILLAGTVLYWPFRFSSLSVCGTCGVTRDTLEWQLPCSEVTFHTRSGITPTPLSQFLLASGITTNHHSHQWVFCHGGGNGIKCARGKGTRIYWAAFSPEVTNFLAATFQYADKPEKAKFLHLVFDPNFFSSVPTLARLIPPEGFTDANTYRSWMSQYFPLFEEELRTP